MGRVLTLALLSPVMLFFTHAFVIRLLKMLKKAIPMQNLLAGIMAVFNVPVILLCYYTAGARDIYSYIYCLLVYNCFAYAYFHFFNMSETARRIRILSGISTGQIKHLSDLEIYYDYRTSLENRFKRLVDMKQIVPDSGGYRLSGRLLYRPALLVVLFRKILGFKEKSTERGDIR